MKEVSKEEVEDLLEFYASRHRLSFSHVLELGAEKGQRKNRIFYEMLESDAERMGVVMKEYERGCLNTDLQKYQNNIIGKMYFLIRCIKEPVELKEDLEDEYGKMLLDDYYGNRL